MASPTDGQLSRLGDGNTSSILITVLNYSQYTGGPEICQHLRWLISAPKSGEGQWRMTSPVTCWAMLFGGSRVFSTSPHAAGSNHGCLCRYPGTLGTVSFLRKGPRSCRKSGKADSGDRVGAVSCCKNTKAGSPFELPAFVVLWPVTTGSSFPPPVV